MPHTIAIALCIALLALSSTTAAQGNFIGKTDRPMRYHPDGRDFVIENGKEFFNRPLYGTNTAFRVDAGDRPEFTLYLPGRGGNLRVGVRTKAGAKWLFDAQDVVARYRPGSMVYEISDPLLGGGKLRLDVIPMSETEGLFVRATLVGAVTAEAELIWAYGGVTGQRGRRDGDIGTEQVPISEYFQLKPEFCAGNTITTNANAFTLHSKSAAIAGVGPPAVKWKIADADKWPALADLLASDGTNAQRPVIVGSAPLVQGAALYLGLQRIAQPGDAQTDLDVYKEVRREPLGQQAGAVKEPQIAGLRAAYKSEELAAAFDQAERHRVAIAERVVVNTPDQFINAAAAALNVAADAVWDDQQGAFMHGAVAWRTRLLGWRGAYSADALGWHDRARQHFSYWAGKQNMDPIAAGPLTQDASVNFARNEPALHSNGDLSNSHYDMNLVYIDALFRHLLWTGDGDFELKVWPVIDRHLAWERRLFRRPVGPGQHALYESYTPIWAGDDLQYNGAGVMHATAYNYFHNTMAVELKLMRAFSDPKLLDLIDPYVAEKDSIDIAMHGYLWLKERGWFAESKDLLGLQLVHPNAALWTFYHTIDSGVVNQKQAWQMSRFVDTQIAHIPVRGPGVPAGDFYTLPTTSWMPYAWSTNNVVMAEVAHTSLAYWQAGRADIGFKLFKSSILDSMYMGICPGNVGMTTGFDMARGESQRDFADPIGVLSRALVEGLFGVHPDLVVGAIEVQPGFPSDWDHAELRHPDFNFSFKRQGLQETYIFESKFSKSVDINLRIPALRDSAASVTVNGKPWEDVFRSGVGQPIIYLHEGVRSRVEVVVTWSGQPPSTVDIEPVVAKGGPLHVRFGLARPLRVEDPQSTLGRTVLGPHSLRAAAVGLLGHRTAFVELQQGQATWWAPLMFEVRPKYEILQAQDQDEGHLRFTLRNNTPVAVDRLMDVIAGGTTNRIRITAAAYAESKVIELPAAGLLPGSQAVTINADGKVFVRGLVTNWKLHLAVANANLETVSLTSVFNDRVTQIFKHEYLTPRSPYVSLALPTQAIGSWVHWDEKFDVDDSGLRALADQSGGRFIGPQGIPFLTPGTGTEKNIAFTSRWDNFPHEITVPLSGTANHVYLLMAGSTNQMQSRFDNAEVIVTYADGSSAKLALENPTNWWPIDQDYFIDDYAFRRPEPIPPRIDLLSGKVRVLDIAEFKGKGGKVKGGAANVLDMPLRANGALKSVTVRTLANEVVIGLMAVTLARGGR